MPDGRLTSVETPPGGWRLFSPRLDGGGAAYAALRNALSLPLEQPDSVLLKGYPRRRADSGEYRIVHEHDDPELRVLLIGKRNDDEVYRLLRRR